MQVFNKLRGISHAEADLALLEDVNPRHAKLTRFSRDPKRYADEILYALLDECDGADIVDHRIYFEKLNENANDASSKTLTGAEQNPIGGSSNTLTDDGQDPPGASSNTLTGETPDDKPSDEETPDDNPSDEEVPDNTSSDEEENVAGQEVDDSKKK